MENRFIVEVNGGGFFWARKTTYNGPKDKGPIFYKIALACLFYYFFNFKA
jgi:hypothetical protein